MNRVIVLDRRELLNSSMMRPDRGNISVGTRKKPQTRAITPFSIKLAPEEVKIKADDGRLRNSAPKKPKNRNRESHSLLVNSGGGLLICVLSTSMRSNWRANEELSRDWHDVTMPPKIFRSTGGKAPTIRTLRFSIYRLIPNCNLEQFPQHKTLLALPGAMPHKHLFHLLGIDIEPVQKTTVE